MQYELSRSTMERTVGNCFLVGLAPLRLPVTKGWACSPNSVHQIFSFGNLNLEGKLQGRNAVRIKSLEGKELATE